MTLIEDLNDRHWSNPKFKQEYANLLKDALRKKLRVTPTLNVDGSELGRLLQAAVHFSSSNDPLKKEAAYRIAISTLVLDSDNDRVQFTRDVVRVILNRLGNFPAESLIFGAIDYSTILSPSIWYQCQHKAVENKLFVSDREYLLTDFQRTLWGHLESDADTVSVSAPTSAGKSFVLKNFLLSKLSALTQGLSIYIVPSRALITQVYEDFLASASRDLKKKIFISTAPIVPDEFEEAVGLYVLTQERLHTLIENTDGKLDVKYVVVDEAQNISSDSRGVVLQSTIEQLITTNNTPKLIFSCPFAENTEIFSKLFGKAPSPPQEELSSPVSQNLILLSLTTDHKKLRLESAAQNFTIGEKEIEGLESVANRPEALLALAATQISEPPSLIYAPGPSSCEEIAEELCKILEKQDDPELVEFSEFVKTQVHGEFSLAETVLYGVGFHYGPLPAIVRRNIEDLFSRGKLQYLVCTSTLLQGVNLPAKNIFILRPVRGGTLTDDIPLTGAEFWNLAGRAGRLRKELEGNVFLLNRHLWQTDPLAQSKKYSIEPALHSGLKNPDALLRVINDQTIPSGVKELEESAFMKLLADYEQSTLPRTLAHADISPQLIGDYLQTIDRVAKGVKIPSDLYLLNQSVSVYRQQQMYDYLSENIVDEPSAIERIPQHPKSDAYQNLWRLFRRIHSNFELLPGADKQHFLMATLALGWMRGLPISSIIQGRIDWKEKKKVRMIGVNPTIREVLGIIESDLRFRYVKYTKCYHDILCFVLEQKRLGHLIERIPSISLYLELGCSSKNMINLIALGLSRTTASLLTDMLPKDEMTIEEIRSWIDQKTWTNIRLPKMCTIELQRIVRG